MARGRPPRRRLLDVANDNHIRAFIPEGRHVAIAEDRTEGMVNYFWEYTRRAGFMQAYDAVQRLANSAYLQGVNDAAVAMAKTGMMKDELVK